MKVIEGKIVVLGSQGVGKTSMVVRYIGKMFSTQISPTIGASFFTCKINIGDTSVKLQVWDTAGQERFRSMAPMYYRNANAALLVYDITSEMSFNAVKSWVRELQSNVPEPMVLSLVGNKADLEPSRCVSEDDAERYAASIGARHYQTSALQNQGIDQVFLKTAAALINANADTKPFNAIVTDSLPIGDATDRVATHTGKVELPAWSIDSVAHGEIQKNYLCC